MASVSIVIKLLIPDQDSMLIHLQKVNPQKLAGYGGVRL